MKCIISYSLFGSSLELVNAAVQNIDAAASVYPSWVCRFYCDLSSFQLLQEVAGDRQYESHVVGESVGRTGTIWRFYAIDDKTLDVVLVRDLDSILTRDEVPSVTMWIESNKPIQAMYSDYNCLVMQNGEPAIVFANAVNFRPKMIDVNVEKRFPVWLQEKGARCITYAGDEMFLLEEIVLPNITGLEVTELSGLVFEKDAHLSINVQDAEDCVSYRSVTLEEAEVHQRYSDVWVSDEGRVEIIQRLEVCKQCPHLGDTLAACKLAPNMSLCFKSRLTTVCPDSPPRWSLCTLSVGIDGLDLIDRRIAYVQELNQLPSWQERLKREEKWWTPERLEIAKAYVSKYIIRALGQEPHLDVCEKCTSYVKFPGQDVSVCSELEYDETLPMSDRMQFSQFLYTAYKCPKGHWSKKFDKVLFNWLRNMRVP